MELLLHNEPLLTCAAHKGKKLLDAFLLRRWIFVMRVLYTRVFYIFVTILYERWDYVLWLPYNMQKHYSIVARYT